MYSLAVPIVAHTKSNASYTSWLVGLYLLCVVQCKHVIAVILVAVTRLAHDQQLGDDILHCLFQLKDGMELLAA
jgi:hypothetical protein